MCEQQNKCCGYLDLLVKRKQEKNTEEIYTIHETNDLSAVLTSGDVAVL